VFYNGYVSYHLLGKAFDLNNYVSYGDDTDRHPKLTYTGTADPNKAGSYPIKATVTDASGNSTSWELTVKVVGSVPSQPSPYIPSMPFSTFVSKHKTANTRFGLDVSQFQGSIDFKAVKNAGCSFVFIRVGTKLGGFSLDTYFKKNLDNAIAAGLDVGIYLYTSDHTDAAARDSARWIVSQLGGRKLTLPVAFDWEELDGFQNYGASINDVNRAYIAFKNELAQSGYSSMLYNTEPILNSLWLESVKSTSPIWLAQYTDKPTYKGDFGIWQVCYGRIAGISANTDFNVLYTDKKYR
jgi:GH25 family lysozyme M1 (1,4-beta-N-acetylmuramidase)